MSRGVAEIARLEEERQVQGLKDIALEWIEVGGGVACYSGPGSWCNMACGQGMQGPVPDSELDRLDAFYLGRGVPVRVELSPYAHPDLAPALAARGFTLRRFETLLYREIEPSEPLGADLPGLELRGVRPGEEELFVLTAMSGFLGPDQPVPASDLELGLRMLARPDVLSVLAIIDGAAVGAASASVRGEVVALFGATVRPAWRRRGVQGALIRARLDEARRRGATLATIGSLPGEPTERNAAREGFRVACTRVHLER